MSQIWVRNVRPPNSEAVDLLIEDGQYREVGDKLANVAPDAEVIDGSGKLLFPGFVDAHTHMDKTLIGMGWHRNEVGPALLDKIENERRLRREEGIDSHRQSGRHAQLAVATGTTHIRTFVDIDTEVQLGGLEGVLQTREDFKDALDIQIVAFPQSGMLVRAGTVELLEDALKSGADVIGGLDPCAVDRDPVAHLDTIFDLAEKHDADVDVHLHERGTMGAFSLELIAERTKVLGWQGRVVVNHAMCLGGVEESQLQHLIELLLENDIAIMSHGPSGGGDAPPVKRLKEAGVRLCTGNDGIRDSWGPLNMPDMLLRCFLVSYRNNFRRDDEIEIAIDMATRGGAQVVGDQQYGLQPGDQADFVLLDGETHVQTVIDRPARSLVVKRGKIVARDGECLIQGAG